MNTKNILNSIKNTGALLYNKEALEEISNNYRDWLDSNKFDSLSKTPNTILGYNLPRELIYTPLSHFTFSYSQLGNPGEEPFTRGIHSTMYRGKEFTMRQITGLGSPLDTNQRIKFMLDNGATGISIVFDIPTIQMYDSDDPMSQGQVGMSGVCIDSIEDMDELFNGIELDKVTTSLVTHYPSNTSILFPMFLALSEERNIPWNKLSGSVQNDITMEELVRSGLEYIPPEQCFRLQCDNIEFIKKNVPKWNFITLNGYNLREFGTSGITEMSVALCNGMTTLDELLRRGFSIDEVANRLAFFWAPGNDFFAEIARIRAVRRLWYKIIKYKYKAENPKSMWMRCHVQTSGISLIQQEPLNNIIRAAYHALASVLSGVQSLHVSSYDEAYSIPTEEAALISLRTQQILQTEMGITDVVDPLGGSYYIETLTDKMEELIINEIDEIEENGGFIESIKSNFIHDKITKFMVDQQKKIDSGEIKIVSSNIYPNSRELPEINVFKNYENTEREQINKLHSLRLKRNSDEVIRTLQSLEDSCKNGTNIIPASIECAKARCTEGELFNVFKKSFGRWSPKIL